MIQQLTWFKNMGAPMASGLSMLPKWLSIKKRKMMKYFFLPLVALAMVLRAASQDKADLIIYNGKVATMSKPGEFKQAVAVKDGIILAVGSSSNILSAFKNAATKVIDAEGKTVIPGLNDSHHHAIREGLNFNSELRW